MKPFILVTKKRGFIEERIKGHICETTPKWQQRGGENGDESAVAQACISRHNYLSGLGRVNCAR